MSPKELKPVEEESGWMKYCYGASIDRSKYVSLKTYFSEWRRRWFMSAENCWDGSRSLPLWDSFVRAATVLDYVFARRDEFFARCFVYVTVPNVSQKNWVPEKTFETFDDVVSLPTRKPTRKFVEKKRLLSSVFLEIFGWTLVINRIILLFSSK